MPIGVDRLHRVISIVIPARNEAATIGAVVAAMVTHPAVAEVIVVDNGSVDATATIAREAGAAVIYCPKPGLGRAMKVGVMAAVSDLVLRTDADISNWTADWIDRIYIDIPHSLRRGVYTSPYSRFPMSNYVVRPFFKLFSPEWADIPVPTTGTYLLDRRDYDWNMLPDNWAIDVAILVGALTNPAVTVEHIEIGVLVDTERPVSHYIPMATDLTEYLTGLFVNNILKHHERTPDRYST